MVKIDKTTKPIISKDSLIKTLHNLQKRNFVIMQPNEVSNHVSS